MALTEWETAAAEEFDEELVLFGESVVYTPKGGVARTIQMVLRRGGVDFPPETGRSVPHMGTSGTCKNDGTLGIAASALNTGGDTLTFADRVGGTVTTHKINELTYHDAVRLIMDIL